VILAVKGLPRIGNRNASVALYASAAARIAGLDEIVLVLVVVLVLAALAFCSNRAPGASIVR
jgi:hypothetical protein